MKYLLFEKEQGIGVLKLNNPEALNALSSALLNEMKEFFSRLVTGEGVRVLILTGEGKAFAAGADISELRTLGPAEARSFSLLGNSVIDTIDAFPIPVIAAVNGYALGGGLELALGADFIHASVKARFGLPELTLGLIPGFSGSRRLSERIGVSRAKELMYTGRMIDAAEALRIGLVNKVSDPARLIEEARVTAREIMKVGPNALREAKRLLNTCREAERSSALEVEANQFGLIFAHPEAQEGLAAFTEKRKPSWQD